jgi:hypothetical protein
MLTKKQKKYTNRENEKKLPIIGWREWMSFPELKISRIKAKVDTGARTSAMHAFSLETFHSQNIEMIRFAIHPLQYNDTTVIQCEAPILDKRWVTDSGGHKEERYVIKTPIKLGDEEWPIEITLTNRDIMTFRMLLGRTALRNRFVVSPRYSFLINMKN